MVTKLESRGGYAEQAVARTDALHIIPGEVTADTAAAIITTGSTALGILDGADARPGEIALVTWLPAESAPCSYRPCMARASS